MNEQTYPWYMVNKDGMCTLCADQADAEKEAKDAQDAWPHKELRMCGCLVLVLDSTTAIDYWLEQFE